MASVTMFIILTVAGDHVIVYDILPDRNGRQYAPQCTAVLKGSMSTDVHRIGFVGHSKYTVSIVNYSYITLICQQ